MAKRSKSKFVVCHDYQRRTCIKVSDNGDVVKFIPLDITGFEVLETSTTYFNDHYIEMPNYPIDKACRLYLNYCLTVGATSEVLDYLGTITTVTKEDYKMAKAKHKLKDSKPAAKKKAESKKKKVVVKPSKKKSAPKSKSHKKSDGYPSAAQMFQGLIMEGKLTDNEIFSAVQDEFGLDDKKRSYVSWYRNNLKKKGENPPEAI